MKTTIKVSKRIFRVEFSEIGQLYTATVCGLVLSSHSLAGLKGKIKNEIGE